MALLVGSIKLQVSFAKEPYKRDDILRKRPIILSILLTVATPYEISHAWMRQAAYMTDTYHLYDSVMWHTWMKNKSEEMLCHTTKLRRSNVLKMLWHEHVMSHNKAEEMVCLSALLAHAICHMTLPYALVVYSLTPNISMCYSVWHSECYWMWHGKSSSVWRSKCYAVSPMGWLWLVGSIQL